MSVCGGGTRVNLPWDLLTQRVCFEHRAEHQCSSYGKWNLELQFCLLTEEVHSSRLGSPFRFLYCKILPVQVFI